MATGRTSVLSKTSISSPSALAATAGEELTGTSRVPAVILGLFDSIHPRRAATRSSGAIQQTAIHNPMSILICLNDYSRLKKQLILVPASVPGSSEISQHFKVRIATARSLNSSLPEENLMSRWLVLSFEVRSPSSVSQLRGPSLFRTEDCGQDTRTRTLTAVQVFFLFFFFGAEDARLTWRSDKSGSERSSI